MVALVHSRCASDARGLEGVPFTWLDLVYRLAAAVTCEVRMQHDLAKLQSLDVAMLHDMDLSRGEVEYMVRAGRPLGAWTERR